MQYCEEIGLIYDSVTHKSENELYDLIVNEGFEIFKSAEIEHLIQRFLDSGFNFATMLKYINRKNDFILRFYYDADTFSYYMLSGLNYDEVVN